MSWLARRGLLLAAITCLLAIGCQRPKDLIVVVSGDTAGWITPCGCTSGQSGGLSRRATLIDQLRRQGDTVVLDVGGAAGSGTPYDLVRLESILRGQQLMGLDAFNIGGVETSFGPDEVRRWSGVLKIATVSANLSDATGKLVAQPYHIVERGGQRVAVCGVIDPDLVQGGGWQVSDPAQVVIDLLPNIKADRIIVLAYADAPMLRELALRLPEVDAVVGGPTGQVLPAESVGPVLIGSATNKGKYLMTIRFGRDREPVAKTEEVVSTFAENALQQSNLAEFYAVLEERRFQPEDTPWGNDGLLGGDGFAIAGSDSCDACHQMDTRIWHDSKHAHAWLALKPQGAYVDPACQRCHTTGYGQPAGFAGLADELGHVNVGCESCHGPSAAHVKEPRVKTPYRAMDQCIGCHDPENSPAFDRPAYWARIVHGLEKANGSVAEKQE